MPTKRKITAATRKGLTPEDILEQYETPKETEDIDLSKVLTQSKEEGGQVLPPLHKGSIEEIRKGKLPSTTSRKNNRRGAKTKRKKVLDGEGSPSLKASISQHLKTIIQEEHPEHKGKTIAEVIAWQIAMDASSGNKTMMEFVRDTTEGKPGQAAKNELSVEEFEKEISELEINLINDIAKKE